MSHILHRDPARFYPVITHGVGIDLYARDGRRYLDGSSGALAANLGHGREDMARAMAEQARKVAFSHTLRFTSEALEELGERVDHLLGPSGHWYTYPTSGGSEAVETAIKLARHVQLARGESGRHRVLAFRPSYHGNSLGALALSGDPIRQAPYRPLLSNAFRHAPPLSDHGGFPMAGGSCPCTDAVRAILEEGGPETFSAIILEPASGSSRSGFVPHQGLVAALRDLAHAHGLLFIADEVMTGFGRTGRILGSDHHDVRPDLLTAAKGLSGGYAPIGAVIVSHALRDEVAAHPTPFLHGFTYSGNPLSAAVAARALRILEEERLVDNAAAMGGKLEEGLLALAARHPLITTVRGRGLMWGLVLRSEPGLAARAVDGALRHGLLLYQGHGEAEGGDGEHLLVGPPLVVDAEGVDRLLTLLDDTLVELA